MFGQQDATCVSSASGDVNIFGGPWRERSLSISRIVVVARRSSSLAHINSKYFPVQLIQHVNQSIGRSVDVSCRPKKFLTEEIAFRARHAILSLI